MTEALGRMTRSKLYEQVLERIRAHAAEKSLSAGDRLPSERELAARLGVSRTSVKQALVVLEAQGLIDIRHGGGAYLTTGQLDAAQVGTTQAEDAQVEELVERRHRLPEVFEAREALETKLAELAAQRRTKTDLETIEDALAYMNAEIKRGEPGIEGDRRFHEAVTAAAKSELLAEFMNSIATQIAESRNESLRQPGRPSRSLTQHHKIAEAIRMSDPKAAAAAMRRHVQTVSKVRLLTWNPNAEEA